MLTAADKASVKVAEWWYNFTECFLNIVLYRGHKGIDVHKNLRYDDGKRGLLDIIEKPDGVKNKPVFIYIHGGGFVSGEARSRRFYCYDWVDKGFVAVNMRYDYAADAAHPEHLRQLFKGMDFAFDILERAGADVSKVVVAGDSAGGYFAAMISAVASERGLYDKFGIEFSRRDTFLPAACITISGLFDVVRSIDTRFPDMKKFARAFLGMSAKEFEESKGAALTDFSSVDAHVGADFPPTFVIKSSADPLRTESDCLTAALEKAGVRHGGFTCRGINGVHAGGLACRLAKSGRECYAETEKFVFSVLGDAADAPGEIPVGAAEAAAADVAES